MPSSSRKNVCSRSEEHTSELQSHDNLVCRLLLEKNTDGRPVPRRRHSRRRHRPVLPRRVPGHTGAVPALQYSVPDCLDEPEGREVFFFLKDRGPPEIPPFPLPRVLQT